MFSPINTDRLVITPVTVDDIEAHHARRNDPEVARYADWTVPFPREHSESLVEATMGMEGPTDGHWWMASIRLADSNEIIGDVAIHLEWGGRSAEIGYTFASDHWGNGYAVESVEAIVLYLFDTGTSRISGKLHPDNRPSAMVLERNGFRFEGHTRNSFWVGDEVSDDLIYGLTPDDWEAWQNRPRHTANEIRLVEITHANFGDVFALRTHKSQESFVAPMAKSLGQALVPPHEDGHAVQPWFRAVEADGVVAGFVMLALRGEHQPETFLWRLLIDRMHQRRGIASAALDLVEDELRSMGDETVLVSWVDGRGSPRRFYEARGYEPTGEIEYGEVVARKTL